MNIWLEIFGYIGTALVIISMMMTSVLKLRIINMCGGAISLIYAVLCNTWPVVVLNACLICINLFQTIRQIRQKESFGHVVTNADDETVRYFLSYYEKDVEKFFPRYVLNPHPNAEIHVIFVSGEIVGVLIGTRASDVYRLELDYVVPRYRDIAVGRFLFPLLKERGINLMTAPKGADEHNRYLFKLGFSDEGGILTLDL